MRTFFGGVAAVSLMVCAELARAADSSGVTPDFVDGVVKQALAKYQVPGAAVAVVKDGKVLLAKGYGIRDLATGAPVNADTIFGLASVSKTFTAAVTAAMVDAGRLRWDQPVVEILPGFQMNEAYPTKNVTPRDLLTHRAGFPGFFGDILDCLGESRENILTRVRYVRPAYSFRDHPEYSNIGFFVAGETAAKAGGASFENLVAEKILKPLGMHRSGLRASFDTDTNVSGNFALVNGKPQAFPYTASEVFASAGGLASTANDLATYARMLLAEGQGDHGRVLSAKAVDTMFQPVIAAEVDFSEFPPISQATGFDYTPGWGIYHLAGRRVLEKGGALSGVRTLVTLVPEEHLGIVVLANLNLTALPEAIRAAVLSRALGIPDPQKEIWDKAQTLQKLIAASPTPPADAKPLSRGLESFLGTYENDLFGKWAVAKPTRSGAGILQLEAGPARWTGQIRPWDGDTLSVKWPLLTASPDEVEFHFQPGQSRAAGFTFQGYAFRRTSTP